MAKHHIMLGGIFAFAILVAIFATGVDLPVIPNPSGQTVSVTGTYTAKAEPTQATLIIGFENEAETASKAQQLNADEMGNVLVALRKAGLSDDDFETLNYNLWDRKSCPEVRHVSYDDGYGYDCENVYVASHTLEVTTDKVDMVGRYLDIALAAGAENIHSVRFSVDEDAQNEMKKDALEKATRDARDKADALAAGMDMEVYRVVSITDSNSNYKPYPMMYAEMDEARAAVGGVHADTQIVASEVEVYATVYAEYELA
jgi:uncharacterized protein